MASPRVISTTAFLLILAAPMHGAQAEEFAPQDTQPGEEQPPTPSEAAAAIEVPDGFTVTLFAGEPDVRQPIAMALDERGRLWVAESYSYQDWAKKGEDRILIFEDEDNDGKFDTRKVFWAGGDHVSGMTVGWGGVWVCSAPNLLFIPDADGDDVPDGEPRVILDGWTTEAQHNHFNGLTWGIDGWLYGRHGIKEPSKVGKPGTPEAERIDLDCAIWRYHPFTEKFEIVCRGTTNPWGLDWNDKGELFFTNNVNGHLWHAIPGALFTRMENHGEGFEKHAYDRMGMCADHLHHAGGVTDWVRTRGGLGVHDELGGGHAHCGGMIYLGGRWPEKYRNTMFLANVHGRRVNNDLLERRGSGYVGRHGSDFLATENPWFRGVTLLYGPDGNVFLSDWCDLGECHDRDGVHRSSGRIYKIAYHGGDGPVRNVPTDLRTRTDRELAALQSHSNEWHARTARRLLQERHAAEKLDVDHIGLRLADLAEYEKSPSVRIRALLTLYVIEGLGEEQLLELLEDKDEHIRATSVRLLTDMDAPGPAAQQRLAELAASDPSPLVRVYLASALRRLPPDGQWPIAEALASHAEDADDANIPLMVWFGMRETVNVDPQKALALLDGSKFPNLQAYIGRRLADDHLEPVLDYLVKTKDAGIRQRVLTGVTEALRGRKDLIAPAAWVTLRESLQGTDLRGLALQLDLAFDPAGALQEARQWLADPKATRGERLFALELLTTSGDAASLDAVLAALERDDLRLPAIEGLASFRDDRIPPVLISRFKSLTPEEQSAAVVTLTSSKSSARALVTALEKQEIPREAVSAYHARRVQALKDKKIVAAFSDVWGRMAQSSAEKKLLIQTWQDQLTADVLEKADPEKGHLIYQRTCFACHILNGEGGRIGPELTGANRADLFYLLENIIDPNASLPRDYRMTIITKKDGNIVTGNIAEENEYTVTLQTLTEKVTVNRKDIHKLETSDFSMMPEGLVNTMKPDEFRDLIAFLQQ